MRLKNDGDHSELFHENDAYEELSSSKMLDTEAKKK